VIAATKIVIGWSESPYISLGQTFTGENLWEEAARYLNQFPLPSIKGTYYKTDFTVHFEDGTQYGGRYDIGSDAPTIGEHIRGFIADVVDDGYWDQSEETLASYRKIREEYEIGA
jgi:hypothetical protein